MDLSTLPAFPTPETPTPAPKPPGRAATLFVQFAFAVTLVVLVYVLQKQAREYGEAEQRQRAARARIGVGKWESTHGDGALLELADEQFTLSRNGEVLLTGKLSGFAGELCFEVPVTLSYSQFHRYSVQGDELVLRLGWEARRLFRGIELSPESPVRFRRLVE